MKKQITIDGENSDWYEKAIFVLKDKKKEAIPDNLFLHAEHIIENYLKKNPINSNTYFYSKKFIDSIQQGNEKKMQYKKRGSKTARKIDLFFNITLTLCFISIIAVVFLMFI